MCVAYETMRVHYCLRHFVRRCEHATTIGGSFGSRALVGELLASTVLRLENMDAGSVDDEDDSSVIDSEGWSQIPDASNKRKNRDSESDDNITRVVRINKTRKWR